MRPLLPILPLIVLLVGTSHADCGNCCSTDPQSCGSVAHYNYCCLGIETTTTTSTTVTSTTTTLTPDLCGDVTGDSQIRAIDALILLMHSVGNTSTGLDCRATKIFQMAMDMVLAFDQIGDCGSSMFWEAERYADCSIDLSDTLRERDECRCGESICP